MELLPHPRMWQGPAAGPHLLLLGGVHGREQCGTVALTALIEELDAGSLLLKAGHLTVVPATNPGAAAQGKQYLDENLNRVFRPHERPTTYEQRLANILCPLVQQADYVLDIHSTHAATSPYVFLDHPTDAACAWVDALGLGTAVLGWTELHQASGQDISSQEYAHSVGKTALTLECGQHKDPSATTVARRGVMATLAHLELIEAAAPAGSAPPRIRLQEIHYKKMPGRFPKPWQNFSPVQAGELLATYEDGSVLTAPAAGCLMLPKEEAVIGEDWLYFAVAA